MIERSFENPWLSNVFIRMCLCSPECDEFVKNKCWFNVDFSMYLFLLCCCNLKWLFMKQSRFLHVMLNILSLMWSQLSNQFLKLIGQLVLWSLQISDRLNGCGSEIKESDHPDETLVIHKLSLGGSQVAWSITRTRNWCGNGNQCDLLQINDSS